jgi:ADP-ribosylglycohydrolase
MAATLSNNSTPLTIMASAHLHITDTLHDRILGIIIGSALGDTIGLYTEFMSSRNAHRVYPTGVFTLYPTPTPFFHDRHRGKFFEGRWTDDTDHCVLLLLSYLRHKEMQPVDFASRLKIWVTQGLRVLDTLPLGLGSTVGAVVRDKDFLKAPVDVAVKVWTKSAYMGAANGSLMRTYPVAFACLDKTLTETFETSAEISMVTHPDPRCVLSCCVLVGLIRGILRGEVKTVVDVDEMIEKSAEWVTEEYPKKLPESCPGLDDAEMRKHAFAKSLDDLKLDDGGIGYVYKALGCAIVLLREAIAISGLAKKKLFFEDAISRVTMAAGDADTNGAIVGALLGAYLGYMALPEHWVRGMKNGDWLSGKGERVCDILGITGKVYNGTEDTDTETDGGKGLYNEQELRVREVNFVESILLKDKAHREKEEREEEEREKAEKKRIWDTFRRKKG